MDYGKGVISLFSKQLIRWATVMTAYTGMDQEINHVAMKWQWQY